MSTAPLKIPIESKHVARTKGPYGQAVAIQGASYVFTSGLTARRPDGTLEAQDIATQTRRVFENIRAVLTEAGAGLEDVVRMTVFLTDDSNYEGMNAVRRELFGTVDFVSSTIICALHAKDALVEVEVTAAIPARSGEEGR